MTIVNIVNNIVVDIFAKVHTPLHTLARQPSPERIH